MQIAQLIFTISLGRITIYLHECPQSQDRDFRGLCAQEKHMCAYVCCPKGNDGPARRFPSRDETKKGLYGL